MGYTHIRFVAFHLRSIDRKARRPVAGHKCQVGIVESNAYRTVARAIAKMIDKLLKLGAHSTISTLSDGGIGIDEKGNRAMTSLLWNSRLWQRGLREQQCDTANQHARNFGSLEVNQPLQIENNPQSRAVHESKGLIQVKQYDDKSTSCVHIPGAQKLVGYFHTGPRTHQALVQARISGVSTETAKEPRVPPVPSLLGTGEGRQENRPASFPVHPVLKPADSHKLPGISGPLALLKKKSAFSI